MKKIKAIIILAVTFLFLSCSKDDPTPIIQSPSYSAFGYFKGTINYPSEAAIPVIFVLEENSKLLVALNSVTLNENNNLLKGNYTITGNQISGSYINPNIIPSTTYSFTGNYDAKTAKFSGTISSGIITLEKRI